MSEDTEVAVSARVVESCETDGNIEVVKAVKPSLVLLDLDTAVLDPSSGDLNEGIACFLSELREKNILVGVFSQETGQAIDEKLRNCGLDTYFPDTTRHSYSDLLTQGEIDPLPDPYFYQYCTQIMNTLDRTIFVTGSQQTASILETVNLTAVAFTQKSICEFGECVSCAMHSYIGFAAGVEKVIYWWDRNDTHSMYIPDPTQRRRQSKNEPANTPQ